MTDFYRLKNEYLGMKFEDIPEVYRNLIRKEYKSEVASGKMTVERYEQLTEEQYEASF